MCQQCIDHVRRIFPDLPEQDIGHLLLGATAFPLAQPDTIEKQLLELKEKTNGTLEGMLAFADQELWKALEKETKNENNKP